MVGRNTSTGNSSFTFDALGRVTSELTPSVTTPSLTSYDDVGNLTSLNNVTQNFDVTGALISTSDGANDVTYEYNATGGRTTRAGPDALTYDWDQSGKLKTLTSSDFTSSFVYNGDGLRKQKTVETLEGVTETSFLWDENQSLPKLISDETHEYVYAGGSAPAIQYDVNDTPSFIHADALGSVRLLTDSNGAETGSSSYSLYGTETSSGLSHSSFGFSG